MMRSNRFYLFLIFAVGFTSLIYEIYATRVAFLFIIETSKALTIGISAFLAGLAVSSYFIAKKYGSPASAIKIIFWLQVGIAFWSLIILRRYDILNEVLDTISTLITNEFIVAISTSAILWFYLFIPALFLGGAFPLINGLYLNNKDSGIEDTGIVYFWDTSGAVLGAFAAGFLLIPYLGFENTSIITSAMSLMIANRITPIKILKTGTATIILLLFGILIINNQNRFLSDNLNFNARFGAILFQETSPFGEVTVGKVSADDKTLFINYRDMCGTDSNVSEKSIGSIVANQLELGARVANIGLGCGFTAGYIAKNNNAEILDIIEINPVVAKAANLEFAEHNGDVLNLPKTRLHIADGFQFIKTADKIYDAIIVDVEEYSVVYSSPLYTRDFFEIAGKKLHPGGILALWTYNSRDEQVQKIILNTLREVFPFIAIRKIAGFYLFFASDEKMNIHPENQEESLMIKKILDNSLAEINTVDNRVIEKYYDLQSMIAKFPGDYPEKYLIK